MKTLLGMIPALGALLLSASPATAGDDLYLRCKASIDMVITNSITSKVIEDRTIDDVYFFKLDLNKKTILDSRNKQPVSIIVQNKIIAIPQNFNNDELRLEDLTQINLEPPYSYSARGTVIYSPKNQEVAYSSKGLCMEIDASVFNEALSQ